jgi:hypothetical protein
VSVRWRRGPDGAADNVERDPAILSVGFGCVRSCEPAGGIGSGVPGGGRRAGRGVLSVWDRGGWRRGLLRGVRVWSDKVGWGRGVGAAHANGFGGGVGIQCWR